jgi:hypothetical protein
VLNSRWTDTTDKSISHRDVLWTVDENTPLLSVDKKVKRPTTGLIAAEYVISSYFGVNFERIFSNSLVKLHYFVKNLTSFAFLRLVDHIGYNYFFNPLIFFHKTQ